MKFQVCFTFVKYENDMLSLCERTNVFNDDFLQLGPLKLIKTMLKSLNVLHIFSPVWNHYQKGSHNTWAT